MSTQDTLSHLRSRVADLTVKIIERQNELDRLVKERDALQLALNSLENIEEGIEEAIGDDSNERFTYRQKVVFEAIPIGRQNASTPSLIARKCPALESDYVRKTLKRLANYGRISAHASTYWREQ